MKMTQKTKQNLSALQSSGSPADGYFYELEADGTSAGFFIECINMGMNTEVVEYQDGGAQILRKKPGRTKANDIIFRRPYDGDTDIWDWRKSVQDGVDYRKDCSLICYDGSGTETTRFLLYNAWPARLVTEYGEDGVGYELLTLTFEILIRDS